MHALTLRKKRLFVMLLAAVAIAFVGLIAISHGRARAETEPAPAEMTPTAAQALVVGRFARQAGYSGPITVTTVRAVYAQALAVLGGQSTAAAIYGGPLAKEASSPVYVVIMQVAAGGAFHLNVSVPPGQTSPSGSVMSVVVNADTGWKLALNLEEAPPARLDELGPQLVTTVPSVGATDAAAASDDGSRPAHFEGTVLGTLTVHRHRVNGWKIAAAKGFESLAHTPIARQRTNRQGSFTFGLIPGRYRIAAIRPSGGFCGIRTVDVLLHKRVHVALSCS
jgi:hypothetical protein